MSIKKARKTLQNKEKFNYDILDKVANSGGLTDGSWDYLEPHAFEIMERIRDGELRNLHVMAG